MPKPYHAGRHTPPKSSAIPRPIGGWAIASYERKKYEWAEAHPDATPADYEAAMARISAECGI